MDNQTHNAIVSFIWGIADDCLRAVSYTNLVQGMSGSPILQDGKLVGAVNHVFVNNPAKGYGIFAENMLNYQ